MTRQLTEREVKAMFEAEDLSALYRECLQAVGAVPKPKPVQPKAVRLVNRAKVVVASLALVPVLLIDDAWYQAKVAWEHV